MSAFIETKIAWFKDSNLEFGYRRASLREEINRQEGIVASYTQVVNPNRRDREHAEAYLVALNEAERELNNEATQRGLKLTEDEEIYWDMYRAIMEERAGHAPEPIDLPSLYLGFKNKYFGNSVPDLLEGFVVKFARLPFDISGACFLTSDAAKLGVTPGIRINEKLEEFPAEAKAALLHEMIHATGIRKHNDEFKDALIELFGKGAYINPLTLSAEGCLPIPRPHPSRDFDTPAPASTQSA